MTNYIAHVYIRLVINTQSVCSQGLLEMEFALPTDGTEASGLSLLRRLWVARFDVEEEGRALAEKYVFTGFLAPFLYQPNAHSALKRVGSYMSLHLLKLQSPRFSKSTI